jgi:predicted PurR-regulated permease PerM
MQLSRVIQYAFFFGLLGLAGYMVWQIVAPFVTALALSAIIVTICYPLYNRIQRFTPGQNKSIASLLTTLVVLMIIVLPIILLSSLVVREIVSFYQSLSDPQFGTTFAFSDMVAQLERVVQNFIPGFTVDIGAQLQASGQWLTGNLGAIFASTISTLFVFFIAVIGSFYFFRDGRELLQLLVKASPLPDREDHIILDRMAVAVRAVATGTVLVALIQGTLTAIGFTLFGIERAILWGSLASVGALIPGVGTTVVTIPAVITLFLTGEVFNAVGLLAWSAVIVGLVDNFLGPYLMSRGNNMHPFIILIAVLGGISLMGPIGFVIGPVIVTLFLVLLEIYNQYIVHEQPLQSDVPDTQ